MSLGGGVDVLGHGELAALTTAFSWSLCAQAFGAAGLRIGSIAVNHLRLAGGVVLLTVMHALLIGTPFPREMRLADVLLFAGSGVLGLTLGDACLFRSWVLIGPALGSLVMTTVPAWAALFAFVFLGERLSAFAVVGMGVTVGGIALAITGRRLGALPRGLAEGPRQHLLGLGLAGLGALGQAGGLVMAKPALASQPALSGTWVRMLCAMTVLWSASLLRAAHRRRPPPWIAGALRDRKALALTVAGTFTGPALGVWLSLVAARHAPIGVATTLMALTPLFVMAQDWVIGRRPRAREVVGAAFAVAGVALLVGAA